MYNSFAGTRQEGATPISLLDYPFEPGEQRIETQKPVNLLGYLIETYTTSGATVLDPTAGAFSSGVACWDTGRKFIGIEKLAKHFDIGVDRLRQLTAARDAENKPSHNGFSGHARCRLWPKLVSRSRGTSTIASGMSGFSH
jgi:DNA modification methylase